MNTKKIALYPGTFDPITNGHFDIIERALNLFDEVIIAVADSSDKHPMFSVEERVEMVKVAIKDCKRVEVVGFDNLTVELAKSLGATVLIRGLRAVSDFEFELQLLEVNKLNTNTVQLHYKVIK